jgi:alkanesulfonate monooxygenase SsuD/methylene tetrahydromethanopterin reductase-like flavin-dependent oxidoreductase (luciferase family)
MVMVIPGDTDAAGMARMAAYNRGVDMVALQPGTAGHQEERRRAQENGETVSPTLQRRIDRAAIPAPYIHGYPYIGSATSSARQFQEVIEAGDLDGFVLTFPDFIADRAFFGRRVLPLLAEGGWVQPVGQTA